MFYFGLSRPKRASLPRRRSLGFVRAGTGDEPIRTSALEATKGSATMYFVAVKIWENVLAPVVQKMDNALSTG